MASLSEGEKEEKDEEEEGREDKVGMEEVCSQLLQHVIEQAENSSGECPSECVLAIPSWCTEEHRGAAIHALNMAGLSVLGVIREPLATLLAFRQNEGEVGGEGGKEEGRYIVIYDLGHSHCDVSVVREDAQGFYQLLHSSSSPPSSLPPSTPARGEAFVDRLVSLCCADFRKKAGCDATESKRAIAKLKKECENALKTLSTSTTVDIEIDSLYEGFDLRTRITRARFESEIFDILKACISAVEAALAAAGVAKEDVGLLLLAGGASRVPKLQQWLQASFLSPAGSTRIKSVDTNPEEGVALGAALQAQLLSQAAAAASSSSSSAGGSGDAHPFTHSLTTSPLSFGLLVTDLPTEEGGKEGGMTTAFFKSFLKHASIASSSKSKIGDSQPFFLIHQGEFLPASQRVRVKKSANDQADISLHVVAAGSEGPVEEGGEESVLTLAEITYRAPEGDQTEEWDLTMALTADGVLRVRLQEKDGGQVLRDVVIRAKKEAQN